MSKLFNSGFYGFSNLLWRATVLPNFAPNLIKPEQANQGGL